jgi:2-polyprenyl-3-methyl-5-hydroxy-6-metoxy-1,4-benzoquinol methylase
MAPDLPVSVWYPRHLDIFLMIFGRRHIVTQHDPGRIQHMNDNETWGVTEGFVRDGRATATPRQLSGILAVIYGNVERNGRRLGWKEKLTSIWRPLYAPFGELLQWTPEHASILDIGCGSGAFLFSANKIRSAAPCYGIDTNRTAIELAQLANDTTAIQFQHASAPDPTVLAQVSVVTLIDVLHHVAHDSKEPLLQSIVQALPAGARILIKDLDPNPHWRAWANRITDYLSTRSKVDYISQTEIEALLERWGFTVLVSKRLHKHVWSHYLVVGDKKG